MYPILLATYLIYNDFLEKRVNVKCSVFFYAAWSKDNGAFFKRRAKNFFIIYQKMTNKQKVGNRHMNKPQNVKLFEHLQDVHQCVSKTITIFKTNFKMMDGCFV